LEEKKKFNPLAKDWLVGNIGKEEVKEVEETTEDKVNKDTVEFKNILEDDETEETKDKVNKDTVEFKNILEDDETKDKVKEGKEDTVGFKNILEDEDVEEK
jgi:hypothetical protein